MPDCPICQTATLVTHDTWEDTYSCHGCQAFFYPEDVGRQTNGNAGVFHIGADGAA